MRYLRIVFLLIIGSIFIVYKFFHVINNAGIGAISSKLTKDAVYVPNYNSWFESSDVAKLSDENRVENGSNVGPKVQQDLEDSLITTVQVKYLDTKKLEKSNSTSTKSKKTTTQRPDWYIDQLPKAYREKVLKTRAKKISWVRAFFRAHNAPLEKYADEFVYASEYYNIDYRLLPAISIVESSGGKKLFRPYNPFGWGKKSYPSFKHAIWDVSRGMSVYYYKLGRKTPELIGEIYNPVTPTEWARKVRYLMNKMPKY